MLQYACRKTLADKRVRVRGRFARNSNEQLTNEDSTHQEMAPKKIDTDRSNHACNDRSELMYCSGGAVQVLTNFYALLYVFLFYYDFT